MKTTTKFTDNFVSLFNFVVDQIERFKGGLFPFIVSHFTQFSNHLKSNRFAWCLAWIFSFFLLCYSWMKTAWMVTFWWVCPSFRTLLPQSRALFELNRVDNPFYGSSVFFSVHFLVCLNVLSKYVPWRTGINSVCCKL